MVWAQSTRDLTSSLASSSIIESVCIVSHRLPLALDALDALARTPDPAFPSLPMSHALARRTWGDSLRHV